MLFRVLAVSSALSACIPTTHGGSGGGGVVELPASLAVVVATGLTSAASVTCAAGARCRSESARIARYCSAECSVSCTRAISPGEEATLSAVCITRIASSYRFCAISTWALLMRKVMLVGSNCTACRDMR